MAVQRYQMCSSCRHISPDDPCLCLLKRRKTNPTYIHTEEHHCPDFKDYFDLD